MKKVISKKTCTTELFTSSSKVQVPILYLPEHIYDLITPALPDCWSLRQVNKQLQGTISIPYMIDRCLQKRFNSGEDILRFITNVGNQLSRFPKLEFRIGQYRRYQTLSFNFEYLTQAVSKLTTTSKKLSKPTQSLVCDYLDLLSPTSNPAPLKLFSLLTHHRTPVELRGVSTFGEHESTPLVGLDTTEETLASLPNLDMDESELESTSVHENDCHSIQRQHLLRLIHTYSSEALAIEIDAIFTMVGKEEDTSKSIIDLIDSNPLLVHIVNDDQDTLLHLASDTNKLQVVNALIAKKAPIDAQNSQGYTAFHNASIFGNLDIMRALHRANANITIKDYDDKTALELVRDQEQENDAVIELIEKFLDPSNGGAD